MTELSVHVKTSARKLFRPMERKLHVSDDKEKKMKLRLEVFEELHTL